MSAQPNLRLVDLSSGEIHKAFGSQEEAEDAYTALERKHRAVLAEITKLKRDSESEAKKHKLWAEAQTAHEWWRLACWHPGVKFGAEEFYQALPRLRERGGLMLLLKAIAGAAYDPGSKRMKNGGDMVYDDFELITRSKAKALNFAKRVPGGEDTEQWKAWLVQRIESHLQGKS